MNDALLDDQVKSSALIRALSAKIEETSKVQFDYFGELTRLATEVSPQISQISRIFPQYTPHDWNLHIRRLFGLADRLIGEDRFALMYPAELFVLAASLFAHDWGMAVSDDERNAIEAGGEMSAGATFRLLDNEPSEIRNFSRTNGLKVEPDGSCPSLRDDGCWREYVRATHAWRSGLRAKNFFEHTDGGVSQAVAAACEGHWVDLPIIDSESRFPAFLNVLDQRINLRAVVLYVRLIDLLDNRMELLACIEGLRSLKRPCTVELTSDSSYVVNAIEKGWAKRWRSRGWKLSPSKPAKNSDLWKQLLDLCAEHTVRFHWVKGHAGHPENERCDVLAVEASQLKELPADLAFETGALTDDLFSL